MNKSIFVVVDELWSYDYSDATIIGWRGKEEEARKLAIERRPTERGERSTAVYRIDRDDETVEVARFGFVPRRYLGPVQFVKVHLDDLRGFANMTVSTSAALTPVPPCCHGNHPVGRIDVDPVVMLDELAEDKTMLHVGSGPCTNVNFRPCDSWFGLLGNPAEIDRYVLGQGVRARVLSIREVRGEVVVPLELPPAPRSLP